MAPPKITIAAGDLQRFIADIFRARGLAPEDAGCVAEVLVWANLRGIESHGVSRVPRYLQFIDQGDLDPKAAPQLHRLGDALFHLDAAHAAGAVAMTRAVDAAGGTTVRKPSPRSSDCAPGKPSMAFCVILNSASLISSRSLSVRVRAPKSATSVRMTVQFSPFRLFGCFREYPAG